MGMKCRNPLVMRPPMKKLQSNLMMNSWQQKKKEVNALSASIETKMARSGSLAVQIAEMKNDLGDTEEALQEDLKFRADLEKNCATKQQEWDVICKTRSEELVALADTIKILNDDDALELFKKTLPGSS